MGCCGLTWGADSDAAAARLCGGGRLNAREWLARGTGGGSGGGSAGGEAAGGSGGDAGGDAPRGSAQGADLVVLGAPVHRASISPTSAHLTPTAIREALARFATWDGDHRAQLEALRVVDLGDVEGDDADSDASASHDRIEAAVAAAFDRAPVVAVFGGDNSLTRPAMRGAAQRTGLGSGWGLLTLDAHHDCRPLDDGATNGTPVRGLITDGLPGSRVAQLGIRGFANHQDHSAWARAQGVQVHRAEEVRAEGMTDTVERTLAGLRAAGVGEIYVDIDIDVLDRAFAPACPASMPGGLWPTDLQEAAYRLGADPAVRAVDFVEVDAAADVAGMTLRLTASIFLAFCAGLTRRPRA